MHDFVFGSRKALFGLCMTLAAGAGWLAGAFGTPQKTLIAERNEQGVVDPRYLETSSNVFEAVANVVSPAVVYLESRHLDEKGQLSSEESGSGVLVRPKAGNGREPRTVLVTNVHVVAGADIKHIDVHLHDGRLVHPSKVLRDEETDLAVLELAESDLPAAKMGDSSKVRIGQWVLAIGSPFGLQQSVTHGIISAKHRRRLGLPGGMRIKEFLQTDAAINPGSSGGPLVNLHGEIVGINTAIASSTGSSSGVGFSIPINLVQWVTSELLTHGKVRRGFLGVEFPVEFTFKQADELGLAALRGAMVKSVYPNTPAFTAGLLARDVILEFDGTPIEDEHHLINVVSQSPIGKSVEVVLWRDRRRQQAHVSLGSWEDFRETAAKP